MHRQIRIFVENFVSRMSLSIAKNYSWKVRYRVGEFGIRFFKSLVFLRVRLDQDHFIIDIIISEVISHKNVFSQAHSPVIRPV